MENVVHEPNLQAKCGFEPSTEPSWHSKSICRIYRYSYCKTEEENNALDYRYNSYRLFVIVIVFAIRYLSTQRRVQYNFLQTFKMNMHKISNFYPFLFKTHR